MIHRHLDYSPDTPVSDLPAAAIADLLQRGDLGQWRPLAEEVAANPFGRVADIVARVIDAYPSYGTSPLWRSYLERCRAAAKPRRLSQLSPAELRRRHGLNQAQVAARLGISQSDLSKLERRSQPRVSTLAAYVRALGGRLRLVAATDTGEVELRLGEAGNPGQQDVSGQPGKQSHSAVGPRP
jgi:DNA-binding phage protein